MIFISLMAVWLISCERKEETRIPFGYDPDFNYLCVLRSSPPYAKENPAGCPEFTYQDPQAEDLLALKDMYKLDSVAGNGDEFSRIFNVFNWVHCKVRHDGSNATPDPENSLKILHYCHETGNGVNCVYMSIVLNEAYLSLGIKSRVIQGNCRKFIFNGDWHAFNIVWSNTLRKWIFMDVMKLACFTDESGRLLSVAEIREHLIEGKTLQLNEDADYNGGPFDSGEYLNYLAKNLYRFSCSVDSRFGNYGIFHLTNVSRVYVHLDPAGDKQDGLGVATNYFTSNPDCFWSAPE